ncbi:MAG TPA: PepSY-like domain-containing protein [Chitinophagaceae bacterium]|jgi:hypothetical protein
MKNAILLLLLMVSFGTVKSFAQIRKVPAEVTDAFKAKYPDAQNVEWKDKITFFEASFELNNADMTADFSSKGEWQETEKKMDFDALPDAVKEGFKKSKYSDWTPGSVTKIERKDKDIQYKVYAEKSSLVQKKFLYFNGQGQLERDTPGV